MNKLIAILVVILVSCLLAACQTTPDKTPIYDINPPPEVEVIKPEVGIGISIEDWEVNFDVATQKPSEKKKCYKVLKVVRLPNPERNIWYKAGLRIGDYIVMVESRTGEDNVDFYLGTLSCDTLESTIKTWFPGKAGSNLCSNWARVRIDGEECKKDPHGFYVERLRFDNNGGFSLETLQVIYE